MRVIQEELVIELFLPPPQLATGGIEFLFALLEGRKENNPVRGIIQASVGNTWALTERVGFATGTAPGVQGLI